MYKLVTAILLAKDKPKGLLEVDVSNFTLKDVLNNYKLGYLVLENSHLVDELFLDIVKMRKISLGTSDYTITITEWLQTNGDKLLPHSITEPDYEFSRLNYTDGYQGGFDRTAIHPYSTISDYPISSKTSLYLSKSSIDATILSENSLVVINGYLHTHVKHKQGIRVVDGCRSMMYAKAGHLGVISFQNAGGVKLVSLSPEMIHKGSANLPYYHEIVLELGIDLTDKGVMLSLAGNFIYSNDIYKVIDPKNGVIVVNLSRLNLVDRIQQTIKVIEMPDLLTRITGDRLDNISVDVIKSDPFILDLIRLSQTFVIVTNQPYQTVDKKPFSYNGNYGRYFNASYKHNIMVDSFGRIVPYFYYGNQRHPFLPDKHFYQIPLEFAEKTQNIKTRNHNSTEQYTYSESITDHTHPMDCSWLDIQYIKPA